MTVQNYDYGKSVTKVTVNLPAQKHRTHVRTIPNLSVDFTATSASTSQQTKAFLCMQVLSTNDYIDKILFLILSYLWIKYVPLLR